MIPARSVTMFVLTALSLTAAAQTPVSEPLPQAVLQNTAKLIGVSSEIDQLQKLTGSTAPPDRWQILWLHQHISEQVMSASLQVDATIAQIDNEISRANEVRGYLADRRDHAVNHYNLLSVIVGGGL